MNESGQRNASKDDDGADLISKLPDPILRLILSRVPSTEEVVRTSILSTRWRYVWTSIPSLNLQYRGESDETKISKFKEFVDSVLLNRSVDLNHFRLDCSKYYSMSTVESWIQAAVMRNVKQLDLTFCPNEKSENMVMPHCLVNCASLEVLRLDLEDRGLILPKVMGFPALRVLQLRKFQLLDGETLQDFLASLPMLEDLTLEYLYLDTPDPLCISCPNLKKLRFDTRFIGFLRISCPNLMYLALTEFEAINIICEGLYSLKEALIFLKPGHMCRLFPGISHLESLNTDLYFLYESLDGVHRPALPNLKTLELSATEFYITAKYLNRIIKHCPQLESLSFRVDNICVYDESGFDGQKYEAKPTSVLSPDMEWIESYKINGEKLKLDISWWKSKWTCIDATWGKKPVYSDWMSRRYLSM